jgi:uncharacterized protein
MESLLGRKMGGIETVVVTGGSSGIGACFIHRLQTLDSRIGFCNISRRKPEINLPNLLLHHVPCDLGKRDQLERAAAAVLKFLADRPGKVLLINNSGFGAYGVFPEPTLEHTLDMLEVNVKAVVHLTGLLLPAIRARGGAIVNVASTAAFQPTPYLATYGATKAFLLHWSLSLREELRPQGVQVIALCPGPTSTEFFTRAGFDQPVVSERFGQTADQVVSTTLRALRRGQGLVVSGKLNKCLATASSWLPKSMAARVSGIILRRVRMPKEPLT